MTGIYKICSKCILDTSDPNIVFDANGVCNHCYAYEAFVTSEKYLAKRKVRALQALVERIKKEGRGKAYDCIIGVSGGVDSTYCAYVTKQLGLRPLAVHMDNGWDSELAVSNIEKTLKTLDIDLYTHVLDWEEFRDLQLAFLKASTPDSEIPTDHAILAVLYAVAARENVKFILSGHNTATEGGGVAAWSQGHGDWKYIRRVQRAFGQRRRLLTFPHYGPFRFIFYSLVKGIKWIQILDYFDYDKKIAMQSIANEIGWVYYVGKHCESIYTRFFQGYILPKKFGYCKKRLHLSSLIWSGQMSRPEALKEMESEDYPVDLQEQDKEYAIKKLGITVSEFEQIMEAPKKTFWDYPSYKKSLRAWPSIIAIYHRLKRM